MKRYSIAHVAVDAPERPGVALARRDEAAEQPRAADDFAGPVGHGRLVRRVQAGPEARVAPERLPVLHAAEPFRAHGCGATVSTRPAVGLTSDLVAAGGGRRLCAAGEDLPGRES